MCTASLTASSAEDALTAADADAVAVPQFDEAQTTGEQEDVDMEGTAILAATTFRDNATIDGTRQVAVLSVNKDSEESNTLNGAPDPHDQDILMQDNEEGIIHNESGGNQHASAVNGADSLPNDSTPSDNMNSLPYLEEDRAVGVSKSGSTRHHSRHRSLRASDREASGAKTIV